MRLQRIARGRPAGRVMFALLRRVSRREVPDIVKVRFYRRRFFGTPFFKLGQQMLRGHSPWTIGERELFGAFVSAKNRCQFCATTHEAVASAALDPSIAAAAIADWRTAKVDDDVKATLGLLEKLTLTPEEVDHRDVRTVLDTGVSPDAIRDAIEICAAFCTINRVADGLDFALPTGADRTLNTRVLLKIGYR